MKTPLDRALDVLHDITGKHAVSRELLAMMISDPGENGAVLRKTRDAIVRRIEADRRDYQKSVGPS